MKTELIKIIKNDTSPTKIAIRCLRKSNPDLWGEILEATNFLPDDAKPKQRVWHIINDVYKIPVCPVTEVEVKWVSSNYALGSSAKAAKQFQAKRGDFSYIRTAEHRTRVSNSNKKTAESGLRKKVLYTEELISLQKQNRSQSLMKKYGVDNPSKLDSVKKKLSDRAIERGATPKHLRTERQLYYEAVWVVTNKSWKEHFDDINPNRINRSENALDHIYSIQQGFRDNIPPDIIGHYTNLRIITLSDNSKKGMRCDKTKDELYEDYSKSIDK